VLGVEHVDLCVGGDHIDHREKACRIEERQCTLSDEVASEQIVLTENVGPPESGDCALLGSAIPLRLAGSAANTSDFLELLGPSSAGQRRRLRRMELTCFREQKR